MKSALSMTDRLIGLLNKPAEISGKSGQLNYLARLSPRLSPLSIKSSTLELLQNSGKFTLIRNLATSNKIMNYYEKLPLIHLLESINETEFTEYKKIAAKIFDSNVFLEMEEENGGIKRMVDNPPLHNTDKELFQELSAFSAYMHVTKKTVVKTDNDLKM